MFARIKYPIDPDQNFWISNPQFKYYFPFSKLYDRDKSTDKMHSSKEMYFIVFLSDPDEQENIYYRIPIDDRIKMLQETFASDIDLEDDLFQECLVAYPVEAMTTVQRAMKVEKDQLAKRANLVDKTELTLDRTEIVGGKSVIIKGTASQVNMLQKDFLKIMENYAKIEERFIKEKALTRVEGGSKLSKSEEEGFWD